MSPTKTEPRGQLPETIDPMQLAAKGVRLTGTLPRRVMTRLTQSSLDDGDVAIDLRFGRNEDDGMPVLRGTIHAAVRVVCQRCLEPMALELYADTHLVLQRPGERVDPLTPEAETLTVDRTMSLSELIENELLLVMPMVPMHPFDVCPAKNWVQVSVSHPAKRI